MHSHVLVPVDLADTDSAAKAVEAARHIARRDGARLSVLTVIPSWRNEFVRDPEEYRPAFDAFLESLADGLEVDGIFKVGGSISTRIIEAIQAHGIDLVVMASHNPRVTDYLIGSNAAHVVLHAPCSVLVVR